MPKKESVQVSESEGSMQSDYDEEDISSVEEKGAKSGLREVNRANILNYESDSSEVEEGEDSADFMPKISRS